VHINVGNWGDGLYAYCVVKGRYYGQHIIEDIFSWHRVYIFISFNAYYAHLCEKKTCRSRQCSNLAVGGGGVTVKNYTCFCSVSIVIGYFAF